MEYYRGMLLEFENATYILAQVGYEEFTLINLETGNRLIEPISIDEMADFINNRPHIKVIENCEEIQSEIENTAVNIAKLVERKNNDYGNSFAKTMDEYGSSAYFIRIEDKLNRLKHLLSSESKALVNESIEDTLSDIIGYTLLMIDYNK